MQKNVILEIEKDKFINTDINNAIEIATTEYFKGNTTKINGKIFDVFNFGNYEPKAETI